MNPADFPLFVQGLGIVVILACALTAGLRWAERRFPRFRAFLDEHWPEPEWRAW